MMTKSFAPKLLAAVAGLVMTFVGHGQSVAQNTTMWTGSAVATVASATDSEENTVFIYNLGKRKYLNRGGKFGTSLVLSDVGMEFNVTADGNGYKLSDKMLSQNASGAGDKYTTSTSYVQADSSEKQYYADHQNATVFTFTSANGQDGTWYRISNNGNYMIAGLASDAQILDDYKSVAVTYQQEQLSDYSDMWVLVTVKERKKKFVEQANVTDKKVNVPGTFLIKDNGFDRRSSDVSSWIAGGAAWDYNTATSNEKNGVYPSSNTMTYYNGVGYTAQHSDYSLNENQYYGAKWTANIKGAEGDLHQTINPFKHGWYEIRCRAFSSSSTATPVLYAYVGNATQVTKAKTDYATANIQTLTTGVPTTYFGAHDLINGSQTIDGTVTYPYEVVVRVYVDQTTGTSADENGYETCSTLTFGVKTASGAASDWLCVDNFELEYLGEGNNNVVLDETQPDIQYMNDQAKAVNSTVYLNRSFSANTWNTVVVPFDMTQNDILSIFGSGTLVSKYTGAVEGDATTIHFTKAASIEAGKLYLVKPTIGEPEPNIEVSSTENVSTKTVDEKTGVVSDGKSNEKITLTQKYYTIPNIVFGTTGTTFSANVEDNGANVVDGGSYYKFTGTYTKQIGIVPVGAYMLKAQSDTEHTYSTGKWQYRTKTASSLGFRGWLAPSTPDAQALTLKFVIDGVEESTTAIEGITANNTTAAVKGIYNINGQLVATDAAKLSSLPKGLYIMGGKKYIVK